MHKLQYKHMHAFKAIMFGPNRVLLYHLNHVMWVLLMSVASKCEQEVDSSQKTHIALHNNNYISPAPKLEYDTISEIKVKQDRLVPILSIFQ